MLKSILAILITTIILFAVVFGLGMIGVWLAWYTIKAAIYIAIGVSIFSLLTFLLRGNKKH